MPKSFRAPDILSALNEVQKELGPDAMVLSVREVQDGPAWKVWQNPQVEVLAMNPLTEGMPKETVKAPNEQTASATVAVANDVEEDVDLLAVPEVDPEGLPYYEEPETDIQSIPSKLPKNLQKAKDQLLFQGMDPANVEKIVVTCQETLSPGAMLKEERVRKNLVDQLTVPFRTVPQSRIGTKDAIFLLGASGAGKTSTVAKLAIYFMESQRKPVTWVCADTIRAGAIAEAKAYTDILNIPLELVYSPEDLPQITSDERNIGRMILVDMPSINPRRENDLIMSGEFLTAVVSRDTYLVAPATAKDVDLQQLLNAFCAFQIDGLIVTKIDESETVGSIVNTARSSRIPLVFLTSGPQVIDRLDYADPKALTERLFD